MRFVLLSITLFLIVFVAPVYVAAQETSDPVVFPQQVDPQKLPQLQQTYLGQLEQYRIQSQKFQVAKGQYIQLQTLASQEEAIKNMRELLVLRALVLTTYIDILDERLNQSLGIPLENKQSEKITLTLLREDVQIHKNRVESAFDRLQLDEEATLFESTYAEIESHSYYILNMIRTGAVRYASDKLALLREAVYTEISNQPLNATKQAEKERGFQEIDRLIESLTSKIAEIEMDVHKTPGKGSSNDYSETSQNLGEPYSNIYQALEFLREIRKP